MTPDGAMTSGDVTIGDAMTSGDVTPDRAMKICLTGASGQLGSEWVARHPEIQAFGTDHVDLTQPNTFESLLGRGVPDVVINCAAYTKVDRAEEESELAHRVNAAGVGELARWCKAHGIRLVHYSTDYVFEGAPEDQDRWPKGYPEDAPIAPLSVYGRSKALGEKEFRESGCDGLILRVAWLCGAHGHNFVKTIRRLCGERDQISVVDDQIGCPAFCADVVAQTMQLLQSGASGTFHLGSRGICSWHEFAEAIRDLSGLGCQIRPIPTTEYPTPARRPHYSKLDTSAYETLTGDRCPDWRASLRSLIQALDSSHP